MQFIGLIFGLIVALVSASAIVPQYIIKDELLPKGKVEIATYNDSNCSSSPATLNVYDIGACSINQRGTYRRFYCYGDDLVFYIFLESSCEETGNAYYGGSISEVNGKCNSVNTRYTWQC